MQTGYGFAILFHEHTACRSPTQRFQTIGPAPGEQVQEMRIRHAPSQTGQHRLRHAVRRRPNGVAFRNNERNTPRCTSADTH